MIVALSVAVLGVVVAAWTPLRRRWIVLAVGASVVVIGFVALLVVGARWMIRPGAGSDFRPVRRRRCVITLVG